MTTETKKQGEQMRLYRGKRKDNGEWVKGCYVYTHDGDLDDVHRHLIYRYDNADFINNFHEVIPETVGQYTGIKNGKELDWWEGDVLSHFGRLFVIIKEQGCFWLQDTRTKHRIPCFEAINWESEVICNIHENPELLENQNET